MSEDWDNASCRQRGSETDGERAAKAVGQQCVPKGLFFKNRPVDIMNTS